MGWTKNQFILGAFNEIGLSGYVYDLTPDQMQTALYMLDAMMASWNAKGIRIGYPLPSSQASSTLDQDTDVPDASNEAIYTNFAIRLAPSYGKTVSPDTKIAAKDSYQALLSRFMQIIPQQLPSTMPAGQGNKTWRFNGNPFIQPPVNPIDAGPDSILEFN